MYRRFGIPWTTKIVLKYSVQFVFVSLHCFEEWHPSSGHVNTTTWMLTKHMEKKLDSNNTRMPQVVLNKSWRQHPTKQQLYGHLPLIMKTIRIRRTRHVGYCWRSKDELRSDVILWTPSHG